MSAPIPFEITTHMVKAGELDFEVDMCGSGDHLALCLHGFPEHAISWRHQLPVLADLGFQAWAPNLRGYGRSSKPEGVDAYHLDRLIEDVGNLFDASGAQKMTILAHDWGAVIAWAFAISRHRPLENLIIMNVPHPAAADRNRSFAQLKKSWYIFFFQIPWLPEFLLGLNGAKAVGDAIRKSSCDVSMFPEDILDIYRDNAAEPGTLTAMINYYRALFKYRTFANYSGADVPKLDTRTLMVWGEEDVALSKELTYGTGDFVTDLTIRYLPGVSHWVQQEAPEDVNRMISAFLRNEPVPEARKKD